MVKKKEKKNRRKKGSAFANLKQRALEFYEHYTAGLQEGDFKKLFTEETRGIYTHFSSPDKAQTKTGENKKAKTGPLKSSLISARRIFWGFILALSPARRIIYGIAFLLFIICAAIIITAPSTSNIRSDAATVSMYTFIIVSFLLALELADKLSAKGELELARELQHSLLPPDDLKLPGLMISRFALTATEVGGDYHDFNFSHGKSCVAVGDVSGHGLAPGVVMAMAKSAWNTQLINSADPALALNAVSSVVMQAGSNRTFMTFLHCQFDIEKDVVEIANAGHIYPLFFCKKEGTVDWVETPSCFPLGVKQKTKFETISMEISAGDVVVLVSDGFVESVDEQGNSFDYSRLQKAFEQVASKEPHQIVEHLVTKVKDFVGDEQQEDDLTLVVIGYKLNQDG